MTTTSTSTQSSGPPSPATLPPEARERLAALGHDADAIALVGAFAAFGPAYQRWLSSLPTPRELSVARIRLLWTLRATGSQRMSDLRERLGVTARNITQLVDGLEEQGLARRLPHPHDRRATVVELTDEAVTLIDDGVVEHIAASAALFEELGSQDRADLLRLLRLLTQALEERNITAACVEPAL